MKEPKFDRPEPEVLRAVAMLLEEQCKRTVPGQIMHRDLWRLTVRSLKSVAADEEHIQKINRELRK